MKIDCIHINFYGLDWLLKNAGCNKMCHYFHSRLLEQRKELCIFHIEHKCMTDIEIVREAIELYIVHYFETIEMSGTVKAQRKNSINYISIDLNSVQWDGDVDKLHQLLTKYLKGWVQKNLSNFDDYIAISSLTIEYLLPEKEGTIQNQSKHLKLFYLPSYYQ